MTCEVLDRAEQRGFEIGFERGSEIGFERGANKAILRMFEHMMEVTDYKAEVILDLIEANDAQRQMCLAAR